MLNTETTEQTDRSNEAHEPKGVTRLGLTSVGLAVGGVVAAVIGAEMAAPVSAAAGLAVAATGAVLKGMETFGGLKH